MRIRRHEDEGFTLVELLVVTVLIGVLAAIAIPTFMNQRQKSYRAATASDLNAVVLSETAYETGHATYTDDVDALGPEGYRASKSVTTHVRLTADGFVACTQHSALDAWLVYDSATATMRELPSDCI